MQRLYDKMMMPRNIKEFLTKLKNKKILILTAILGILMMLLGSFGDGKSEKVQQSEFNSEKIDEQKLEKILESIEGAGKVKIFITYQGSGENVLAYDYKRETSDNSQRVEINIKNENGSPYIVKEYAPKIAGILVTATGADTTEIKMKLIKSIKAATGIPSNRIYVEKGE